MRQLTELAETDQVQALERFALMQAHLEQGLALPVVAEAGAIPLRTAKRWIQLYRAHGLAGLARRSRTDRGKRRSVSPEGIAIVEGLALQRPLLSVAAIRRELALWAAKADQSVPSHDTVRRIVESISPALTVLGRDAKDCRDDVGRVKSLDWPQLDKLRQTPQKDLPQFS